MRGKTVISPSTSNGNNHPSLGGGYIDHLPQRPAGLSEICHQLGSEILQIALPPKSTPGSRRYDRARPMTSP